MLQYPSLRRCRAFYGWAHLFQHDSTINIQQNLWTPTYVLHRRDVTCNNQDLLALLLAVTAEEVTESCIEAGCGCYEDET